MAVGANHDAFLCLSDQAFKSYRVSRSKPHVLLRWVEMMKLQRRNRLCVAAELALPTEVIDKALFVLPAVCCYFCCVAELTHPSRSVAVLRMFRFTVFHTRFQHLAYPAGIEPASDCLTDNRWCHQTSSGYMRAGDRNRTCSLLLTRQLHRRCATPAFDWGRWFRTTDIRLQRPTFCQLNYAPVLRGSSEPCFSCFPKSSLTKRAKLVSCSST